jgi:diaminohydroxyphosphoribosylaminopyrimidine deaminase / 5-amino-6-(5-phosphoribosylamino)uracil reductase
LTKENYIQKCLDLAVKGLGNVSPNPMVGAVLVYRDKIIGEGYHEVFGGAHAEVNCITSVTDIDKYLIEESTLYVSLEPCAHYGKTPPCTELIVSHNIKKVVIASLDCNPLVAGRGVSFLESNDIEVTIGILDEEQKNLNKRFYTFYEKKRPYIVLKWAESADGFIGKENEKIKISTIEQDREVHQWRSEEQAILIGTQTALIDNPQLNNRLSNGRNPIRIILDRTLSLPHKHHIFDQSIDTIILNNIKDENKDNLQFVKIESFDINTILDTLYQKNIQSILVEGGKKTLESFIKSGLYDEVRIVKSDIILGEGISVDYSPIFS